MEPVSDVGEDRERRRAGWIASRGSGLGHKASVSSLLLIFRFRGLGLTDLGAMLSGRRGSGRVGGADGGRLKVQFWLLLSCSGLAVFCSGSCTLSEMEVGVDVDG